MSDYKIDTLNILKNYAPFTAIIPANKITISWPVNASAVPCATANLLNSQMADAHDNLARSDDVEIEVHIFGQAGTNIYAAAQAASDAMRASGWWRYFGTEITDPTMNIPHWILRFSNKIFL